MPRKDKKLYNEYMNNYMKERWKRRRLQALIYLGSCCSNCGISHLLEPLHFHHQNPKEKSSSIARFSSMNEDVFWEEIDKCILLCEDCHILIHRS